MFEKGLKGKKFPAASLAKAYGWGSDYDYLESMYDTGKDIHDRGLQNVIDEMAQDYALDHANDTHDQKELQTLEEDTFDALDELNAETRKAYHYSCDPSGLSGTVDATSEKEAQRKVEEILAGKGIYVPDELITIDEGLTEELKVITDFSDYKPWSGAVDTYNLIEDADKLDELESYLEELYPDGLTVTQINDILWFDADQILSDLGINDDDEDEDESEDDAEDLTTTEPKDESLEEHVNDRPADIESDQEYQGVDNAVVDCKKYTLAAHSEDEKPVDCKLEKPALEEPLAGEKVNAKLYETADTISRVEQVKTEVERDGESPITIGGSGYVADLIIIRKVDNKYTAIGHTSTESGNEDDYEIFSGADEGYFDTLEDLLKCLLDKGYFDNKDNSKYADFSRADIEQYLNSKNESLQEAKKDEEALSDGEVFVTLLDPDDGTIIIRYCGTDFKEAKKQFNSLKREARQEGYDSDT